MIRFDQVTKTYAGTSRPALNGVDLEVLKGEFVFLVGASGSGKSSFLRLVLKEERPSKGKIHVLGHELNSLPSRKVPYFRRSLGVVFQDFRLLPQKTVFDNVAFSLQVIGKSKGFIQEAVPDVLKMVGLAGKQGRFPHELSGGEQQRVAIARAIVNKPAILLADEPTGNLDPATSAGIMALLSTINANGTTVLMATHDSGIVDQMKRRVIELVSGQVVRDERAGGYQTQAIPVQTFDLSGPLPTGAPTSSIATVASAHRETAWILDDAADEPDGRVSGTAAFDFALDRDLGKMDVGKKDVGKKADDIEDESDAHPATSPIEIPVAPPGVVAASARVTAAPAPGRAAESHDPASPPPLNEPGRRA